MSEKAASAEGTEASTVPARTQLGSPLLNQGCIRIMDICLVGLPLGRQWLGLDGHTSEHQLLTALAMGLTQVALSGAGALLAARGTKMLSDTCLL